MLQNDGILPLDPAKCGKVLVLGDLAEENLADWYSGSPVETNAPLESIKNIVGEETVSIVGTHDHCAIFNEEENGWLCVDKDGKVSYDSNEDSRAIFEEIDWGYNSVSYRNVDSKKYLNITRERELGCTGDDVWGWFTHELFLRDIDTGAFLPHGHLYGDRYNSEQKDELGVRISKLRREILTDGMAPAIDAAVNADTILVVLGNHTLINGRECFDRPSIAFPPRWTKLLERLAAVNKNVVLTIIAGYPFGFAEQSKFVRAVLYTTHGEQYVGRAVADTLFGRNNPAGRLSMTWYLSDDDLPDINDYDIINSPRTYMYFDKPVQYPFGYGLSYTSFEYKDISAKQSEETSTENCGGGGYTISCVVRNCGDRDGDEVVQLYATFNGVSVKAPIKQLCGFKRINLAPDEKVTVEFFVPAEELRLFDEKANAFSIIPESIVFAIGASSADIRLTVTL
jgi:beta-glucosidase